MNLKDLSIEELSIYSGIDLYYIAKNAMKSNDTAYESVNKQK